MALLIEINADARRRPVQERVNRFVIGGAASTPNMIARPTAGRCP
ncbi:hypothetical protein [Salinisphaera sp. LB1]|nr:hypothetical protein [Salinisphaera sp. LB1]AWN17183.1 hypothetical protein SALB1_2989 [Salinisphaera sp. LB1]